MSDKSPCHKGHVRQIPPATRVMSDKSPQIPRVYGTSAHPAQNIMSSDIDLDAKMRELNDMDRPTRHAPQILFNFSEPITK